MKYQEDLVKKVINARIHDKEVQLTFPNRMKVIKYQKESEQFLHAFGELVYKHSSLLPPKALHTKNRCGKDTNELKKLLRYLDSANNY